VVSVDGTVKCHTVTTVPAPIPLPSDLNDFLDAISANRVPNNGTLKEWNVKASPQVFISSVVL
jgi:hypothetical protein